jgi:hypothetical protein
MFTELKRRGQGSARGVQEPGKKLSSGTSKNIELFNLKLFIYLINQAPRYEDECSGDVNSTNLDFGTRWG